MSEHVLPPLLTEERVMQLLASCRLAPMYLDSADAYISVRATEIKALCDAWLASRKPREVLVVDDAPYNRGISPADVPSAGVCGTCIDGKALAAHGRNSADFELALVVCPDCNGTGRVAASDATREVP